MQSTIHFAILLSSAYLIAFSSAYTDCSNLTVQPINELTPAYLKGLNTTFYKKFVSANGIPIMSSNDVDDYTLKESARIVEGVTRNLITPEYLKALLDKTERISMWGPHETACSIPEVADDPQFGTPCNWTDFSGGVAWDNILILQQTSFQCDARGNAWIGRVLVHEFSHGVNFCFDDVQPGLQKQLNDAYRNAWKEHIWPPTEYAMTSPYEYFAIGSQTWFDANEVRHCKEGACNKAQLQKKDPELYNVVAQVFTGPDWLYKCDEFCDPNQKSSSKPNLAQTKKNYFGKKKLIIRDDYSKLHG